MGVLRCNTCGKVYKPCGVCPKCLSKDVSVLSENPLDTVESFSDKNDLKNKQLYVS